MKRKDRRKYDLKFLPERFSISIGGFMGRSYFLGFADGIMRYETTANGYTNKRTEMVKPTEEQWKTFWDALDSIGVWDWRAKYPNPGVLDGTQWAIDIAVGDKVLKSQGDNNYPGENGTPLDSTVGAHEFNSFLNAVSILAGGREIS